MRSGDIADFLSAHPAAIVAELISVKGSSPREEGAFMLVAPDALLGTIGGGALEYLVIRRARQALRDGETPPGLDIPLGPEIGQCCGGRVGVSLQVMTATTATELQQRQAIAEADRPHVYVFGSGHVGKALVRALAPLPLHVHVVDTRPDELGDVPAGVEARAVPMPESVVRSAPPGSSYVILTHDHALDFLIAAEALARADAPYIGMVGSRTKRAKFAGWYAEQGGDREQLQRLVLPIGALGLVDKRPEVIAALAAAEILIQIGRREVSMLRAPESKVDLGAAVD